MRRPRAVLTHPAVVYTRAHMHTQDSGYSSPQFISAREQKKHQTREERKNDQKQGKSIRTRLKFFSKRTLCAWWMLVRKVGALCFVVWRMTDVVDNVGWVEEGR